LALALDEPKEDDEIIDDAGLTFLVESSLWAMGTPFHIDFTQAQPDAEYTVSSPIMESNTAVAEDPKSWNPPACSLI